MPKRLFAATVLLATLSLGANAAPAARAAAAFGPDTIADLAEKAAPAVVNIDTVRRQKNPMAQVDPFFHRFFGTDLSRLPQYFEQKGVGSGFVIDASGLVLTNHHVTQGASTIKVTLSDGRSFDGKVIGKDPGSDLALVKIEAKGLSVLKLADAPRVRVGEWVVAIGSPLGLSTTVTAGIVSALNRDVAINDRVSFIQTDAPINPGNSGGPLLNLEGRVIGVNTAIAAKAQGIGFAIPVETVKFVVSELREKGKVERPWLGVAIAELTPERAAQLFRKTDPGVLVRDVAEGSPAATAGILEGDVIVSVDGKPVSEPSHVTHMVANHRVGDKIKLLVSREGQRKELVVTLKAVPAKVQEAAEKPADPEPDEER
ncbi:trypsin-like peptidase domain-containing protein [bacterium]|nr:trypsin-like peptidase domain-containing protein [bacterium]